MTGPFTESEDALVLAGEPVPGRSPRAVTLRRRQLVQRRTTTASWDNPWVTAVRSYVRNYPDIAPHQVAARLGCDVNRATVLLEAARRARPKPKAHPRESQHYQILATLARNPAKWWSSGEIAEHLPGVTLNMVSKRMKNCPVDTTQSRPRDANSRQWRITEYGLAWLEQDSKERT